MGAFLGILLVSTCQRWLTPRVSLPLMIASFGATAVLLFGAPESKMAQPRNCVGGRRALGRALPAAWAASWLGAWARPRGSAAAQGGGGAALRRQQHACARQPLAPPRTTTTASLVPRMRWRSPPPPRWPRPHIAQPPLAALPPPAGGHLIGSLIGCGIRAVLPLHLDWLSAALGMSLSLTAMQAVGLTHPPGAPRRAAPPALAAAAAAAPPAAPPCALAPGAAAPRRAHKHTRAPSPRAPAGGATALIAASAQQIGDWAGFKFVLTAVFGAIGMTLVALVVNNLSPRRVYPTFW